MDDVRLLRLTAAVITAYVGKNRLPPADLHSFTLSVHEALKSLDGVQQQPAEAAQRATAAQIRRSIRPDGLVSFIDGKSYKLLGRHLSARGMTPEAYCERFGLPSDYPMICSSYAATRSEMARAMGFGKGGRPRRRGSP